MPGYPKRLPEERVAQTSFSCFFCDRSIKAGGRCWFPHDGLGVVCSETCVKNLEKIRGHRYG